MYNQEIKERFLSELTEKNAKSCGSLFDRLSDFELSVGQDVASLGSAEFLMALSVLKIYELPTLENTLTALRRYSKWCISQGLISGEQSGILQVSTDDVDPSSAMSKMFFRDKQDFLYSLRKVAEFDDLRNGVIALALGWVGLSTREALAIRDSGVDLVSRTISDPSGAVIVDGFSDDIARIFELYRAAKTATRENGATSFPIIKDLSHDGFIKRVCSPNSTRLGDPVSERQIITYVRKINMKYIELGYAPRFSMENAQRCGGLYRLWQLEHTGVDILNKKNADIVEKVYGHGVYRKIAWQYKFYKKAFNL